MEENKKTSEEQIEKIDITSYIDDMWRGVKKLWILLILLPVLMAGLMIFYTRYSYEPRYEAYRTFVVRAYSVYESSDSAYYNETTAVQMAQTFPYILNSNSFKKQISEALGESIATETITASSVSENTSLFTIKVESYDPERAYRVLEAVVDNYDKLSEPIIGPTELRVMDDSGVPGMAMNPRSLRNSAVFGGIIGLLLSFGLLALYALTRSTVRRENDLQKYVSIDHLGSIPQVHKKVRSKNNVKSILYAAANSTESFNESISGIRNRLERKLGTLQGFEEGETEGKVIMVTSAMAGEGKSTVAANLAIALANKRNRVMLLDGDLRNPSLHEIFGEETTSSMISLLDRSRGERVKAYTYKKLPLAVVMGEKSDFIESHGLQETEIRRAINYLRKAYDYVIIDTPPAGIVPDAMIFARHVDSVVLVIRQDYTSTGKILQTIESLSETGAEIAGYVINFAKLGITGSGSGYGYGYGYGYGNARGYGYGSHRGNYGGGHYSKRDDGKEDGNGEDGYFLDI